MQVLESEQNGRGAIRMRVAVGSIDGARRDVLARACENAAGEMYGASVFLYCFATGSGIVDVVLSTRGRSEELVLPPLKLPERNRSRTRPQPHLPPRPLAAVA